jgi:predicted MFS family arabinose efflux permease
MKLPQCPHGAHRNQESLMTTRNEAVAKPAWAAVVGIALGVARLIGTSFGGKLVDKRLRESLVFLPLALAAIAVGLLALGRFVTITAVLVFAWGRCVRPRLRGLVRVGHTQGSGHAETAGGIFVAAIQLSAAVAAMAGGVAFDWVGSVGVFALSAAASVLSALIVGYG